MENNAQRAHIDQLLETMARRGAAHAVATRDGQARYWPTATRSADGTVRLGTTSDAPRIERLPDPVTRLDWDTSAAVDERIMEEACKTAQTREIGMFEIELEAALIAGAIVTGIKGRNADGSSISLPSVAAGLYASTRCRELTSSTLEEEILVASPLTIAVGELVRETCALDKRWQHDRWVRWHATVVAQAEGGHSVEIQRYRLEPMKEGKVKGRQAQVIDQMREQGVSPIAW